MGGVQDINPNIRSSPAATQSGSEFMTGDLCPRDTRRVHYARNLHVSNFIQCGLMASPFQEDLPTFPQQLTFPAFRKVVVLVLSAGVAGRC